MQMQSLAGQWQFRQASTSDWLPATVPGGVHTDLLALGKIPDPFVADNEKKVMWVAEQDWDYRHTFQVEAAVLGEDKVFLVADGLDTLATVTLNGKALGDTDNMFRRYEWEVKPLLKPGDNELLIQFRSPVAFCAAEDAKRPLKGVTQAIAGGPHLRKAPCQFGWDWGPMLPPIGVWQDIRLEGRSIARLEDVHLRQRHAGGSVAVSAAVAVDSWQDAPLTIRVCADCAGRQHAAGDRTGQRRGCGPGHGGSRSAALVAQRLRRPAALQGGRRPLDGRARA